jgi:hypothetical protein
MGAFQLRARKAMHGFPDAQASFFEGVKLGK